MTEQTNAPTNDNGVKGYNIDVTVMSEIDTTPNAKGTAKLKFRGSFVRNGKTFERTVIAQGKAADAVAASLVQGETTKLRIIFDHVQLEDGKQGGEFLTVLGLPLPPKKKAA